MYLPFILNIAHDFILKFLFSIFAAQMRRQRGGGGDGVGGRAAGVNINWKR